MNKLIDEKEKSRLLEILERGRRYSQTKNLTNSTESPQPECSVCNDTGTINELVWVESELLTHKGEPMMIQVIKTDPKTGKPPLCECHQEKIFEKYNAAAGMKATERNRYFETAEIDEENRAAYVQARQFVQHIESHIEKGSWLYIYGDEERAKLYNKSAYGTGKSYLTHCIGNYLTQIKAKAIYTTEDKLYSDIKATYSRDSEETEGEVIWRYENVPVLLIDDMFKSKVTDWVEDKAFHLLNNRLTPGKVTIINSNFAPNRINLVLPKNGPAIASRILGQAALIEMIGKDRRRGAAKKRYMEGRGA